MSPQRLASALPEGFLATKLPPQEPLQLRNSKSQRPRRPSQSGLEVPPCEKREPAAFRVWATELLRVRLPANPSPSKPWQEAGLTVSRQAGGAATKPERGEVGACGHGGGGVSC